MKNSFYHVAQRFSIRKYSFGAASVLLGVFLLSGVQTAHADEQMAVSETTTSITRDNGVVSDKVTSSNAEVVLSEATVSVPKESLVPAEVPSSAVTPEKASESSQHVEKVIADEIHKVENTTEPISTVEEKVNETTDTVKLSDKKITTPNVSNETNKKIESEGKELNKVTVTEKISEPKVPEVATDNKPSKPRTGYSRLFSVGNIRRPMSRSTVIGDNYPWPNAAIPYAEVDPWGLYKRECVSFVAYRLSTVNGFTIPYAYGNANLWGYRAQNEGYRVDMNPAAGSVAWFTGNKGFHVAWVVGVNGENVEIEEYNYGYTNRYNHRFIPRNSASGYIHFKDLKGGNTRIPDAPTPTNNTGSSIASSGSYQFTERVSIKAEPKISAPELAYYEAGNTVNYDKTLQADGYVWISYLSYAGNRRYIPVQKLSTEVKPEVKGTINVLNKNDQSGTFDVVISNVSSNVGLKEVQVPIWSVKNGQDDLKWYKAVKQSDGTYKTSVKISDHKNDRGEYLIHLYYVTDSGKQIGVGGTTTTVESASTTSNPSKPLIPNSGVYTFKGYASIKAEPKISAPELAYYDAGNTVNYDSLIQADGHYWISYLSYSGARRYIAIS
ncbi:SH3 domain-containing protein [Streptococcus vestibularis]|uniref:SH3 domain-containing protein n=1 Tax=Streptococcus vestibularis TaxID=1343 RepID=UPI001D0A6669|nr:SH3 domain-containing protein [Streptococcus vestibularis]MCB8557303.1 SH3 domain-containing protein [Streptococcus vestibularis]MCB8588163.1 SH3 domain-containing protein [Streptococcus vestibularis]